MELYSFIFCFQKWEAVRCGICRWWKIPGEKWWGLTEDLWSATNAITPFIFLGPTHFIALDIKNGMVANLPCASVSNFFHAIYNGRLLNASSAIICILSKNTWIKIRYLWSICGWLLHKCPWELHLLGQWPIDHNKLFFEQIVFFAY